MALIRRFMVHFGPISSVFDFGISAVMLWVFNAAAPLFRSGSFAESLATQTVIVFVIRTRRVPFFRSRPSKPLPISVIAVAKYFFYEVHVVTTKEPLRRSHHHRVHRLAARWSHHRPLPA